MSTSELWLPPYHELPPLTPPQVEALEALDNARSEGIQAGYLNMATGLGKTRILAEDVKSVLEEEPRARVIYLCHKNEILRQAKDEFSNVLGSEITQGDIFGGQVTDNAQITFASIQQLNVQADSSRRLFHLIPPEHYDYVATDEFHHGPAPTWRAVLEHVRPSIMLVGATAIPDRRDQQSLDTMFGPELYRKPLEEAIAEGYLARPEYRVLTDHVRKLEAIRTDLGKITLSQLNSLVFVPKRDEEIIEDIERHLHDVADPRVLYFANNISHAEYLAGLVPGRVGTWHSKLPEAEQAENIHKFRNGEIDKLLTVDKANEGVNIPECNVVVFLRATESRAVFLQQLGRGLRKIPGKDEVLVLDYVSTWERIKDVQALKQGVTQAFRRPDIAKPNLASTPFHFDFSEEALEAIEVIRYAREQRNRPKPKEVPKRLGDIAIAEALLRGRLPKPMREHHAYNLMDKICSGDIQARDEFLLRYAGILYSIAKRQTEKDGGDLDDCFQEIHSDLLDGLAKYNKKYSPKAFAYGRAHNVATRRKGQITPLFNLPLEFYDKFRQIEKKQKELEDEFNREPSIEELAEALDEYPQWTSFYIGLKNSIENPSIYNQAADDDSLYRDELLELPDTNIDLDEIAYKSMLAKSLFIAMKSLSYRERLILARCYGLVSEPQSYDEIGRDFNVTRTRVSQVVNGAIKKLRSVAGPHKAYRYGAEDADIEQPMTEKQRFNAAWEGHLYRKYGYRQDPAISPAKLRDQAKKAQDRVENVQTRHESYGQRELNPDRATFFQNLSSYPLFGLTIDEQSKLISKYGAAAVGLAHMLASSISTRNEKLIKARAIDQRKFYYSDKPSAAVMSLIEARTDIEGALDHMPGRMFTDTDFRQALRILDKHSSHDVMQDRETGNVYIRCGKTTLD